MNEEQTQTPPAETAITTDLKTKTIKLPSGKTAEVRTRVNVRQHNDLKKVFHRGVSAEVTGTTTAENIKQQISGDTMLEVADKAVQTCLIAYGNNRDNPVEELLNSDDVKDYEAVVEALAPIIQELFTRPSK